MGKRGETPRPLHLEIEDITHQRLKPQQPRLQGTHPISVVSLAAPEWDRALAQTWDPHQETGHGVPSHSGSYVCCALCLAKEQMFNNFAAARKRLHNMAELFLNFGKC